MDKQTEILQEILKFRQERDWKQFHTIQEMIKGLSVEAGELLAETLWLDNQELQDKAKNTDRIKDELADVYYWLLLIAHDLDFDLNEIMGQKLQKNRIKYPIEVSRGSKEKYSDRG